MRLNPVDLLRPSRADAPPLAAPLSGSRAQAAQRLQVGVFGLAAMLLLVALASVINSKSAEYEAPASPQAEQRSGTEPAVSDPLADAGVVPDTSAAQGPEPASSAAPAP